MTRKQQMVLDYLKTSQGVFISPKAVSTALGVSPRSSSTSKILKGLVAAGLVERSSKGHYMAIVTPVAMNEEKIAV